VDAGAVSFEEGLRGLGILCWVLFVGGGGRGRFSFGFGERARLYHKGV
jgi:hypothetical protein